MAGNDIFDDNVKAYINKVLKENPSFAGEMHGTNNYDEDLFKEEFFLHMFVHLKDDEEYRQKLYEYIKEDGSDVEFELRFLDLYHEYEAEDQLDLQKFLPELADLLDDDASVAGTELSSEAEDGNSSPHKPIFSNNDDMVVLNTSINGEEIELEFTTQEQAEFAYVYIKILDSKNSDIAKKRLEIISKSGNYKNVIDNIEAYKSQYPQIANEIDDKCLRGSKKPRLS